MASYIRHTVVFLTLGMISVVSVMRCLVLLIQNYGGEIHRRTQKNVAADAMVGYHLRLSPNNHVHSPPHTEGWFLFPMILFLLYIRHIASVTPVLNLV